jgi:hypothetical protein
MQLKWGTYSFNSNGCEVLSRIEALFSSARIPYAQRRILEVTGYLEADGQAALTAAQIALENALKVPYQDLVLYQDGGAVSATLLRNQGSLGGVVITSGPHFTESKPSEYATVRKFKFTAEAECPITNPVSALISFSEKMTYSGGGPLYVMKRAINGPPQRQMVYPATEYVVSQTGEAVGYMSYPTAPPPRWPAALKETPVISRVSPMRIGLSGYRDYRITWDYKFESVTPLIGAPTVWRT